MTSDAAYLAARLAENAEAVCREYLSEGRRCGRYWLVGDTANNPGRSLFVRLAGPPRGPGAVGHWTDAASGEHGDLLDLIFLSRRHTHLRDALEEARAFLSEPSRLDRHVSPPAQRSGSPAARRLFAASQPLRCTLAEAYLRSRGITPAPPFPALRFHSACYYRADKDSPLEAWPALIAAVTDLSGKVTGVLRTWLARDGTAKAPVSDPRRAMGELLGHAVRFGPARACPGPRAGVLAAGEGIETMLSLKLLLPDMPMVAALSASNLAALLLPQTLRRLYVAADNDKAGLGAMARLTERAGQARIETHPLLPCFDDWNTELIELGFAGAFRTAAGQLLHEDAAHFGRPLTAR